jgi:hypothetical protein
VQDIVVKATERLESLVATQTTAISMPTLSLPNDEAAILARAIDRSNWPLTVEAANAFLLLKLAEEDKVRMDELAAKARDGNLTADEELEIEEYRQVGCLIELVKSQARSFLSAR